MRQGRCLPHFYKSEKGKRMLQVLLVGIGGCLGAICRYGIGQLCKLLPLTLPLATFLVNIMGAFFIGVFHGLASNQGILSPNGLLFLTTGLLGGFTTFSTFSLESINLLEQGKIGIALSNIILQVGLGLLACYLGKILASQS